MRTFIFLSLALLPPGQYIIGTASDAESFRQRVRDVLGVHNLGRHMVCPVASN